MSYKDFIEKFVESSSLSEKDSKLLALEMESDFYAKEKDLILNNEKDTMKKIEDDFGDKDKLAEQMFLAHHKYLNVPILGPLFYFKTIRWIVLILLMYPINVIFANLVGSYAFPLGTTGTDTPLNSGNLVYVLGYTFPFIIIIYLFIKFKAGKKDIILSSVLSLAIIILLISSLFFIPTGGYSGPVGYDLIIFLVMASPYILLILITLALKKILKK